MGLIRAKGDPMAAFARIDKRYLFCAVMAMLLPLALAIALAPGQAHAVSLGVDDLTSANVSTQADIVKSGECGTCSWTLDSEGAMVVSPTDGKSGVLDSDDWPWKGDNANVVTSVSFEPGVNAGTTMYRMFSLCGKLKSVDLSNLDTSDVTNMAWMFGADVDDSTARQDPDIEMTYATSLNLTGVDTSKVTDMHGMFYAQRFESLDLSGFDTSNVTDMSFMFWGCENLESIDLSSFDTSKVTDMRGMFWACRKVSSLDLTSFDTSKVETMHWMFMSCDALEELDLSSFDTSNVTDMGIMFWYDRVLKTIYVGDGWSTAGLEGETSMFYNCPSLVGGAGTKCDGGEGPTSLSTYARVDGGPGSDTPGYLTLRRSLKDAKVTLSQGSYYFDGKAKEPAVTVMLGGEAVSADGYDVAYEGNVEVGIATVTVTGKGLFRDSASATFAIVAPASMHRLYNAWSGEHFYTSDDAEYAGLVKLGWKDEGEGWRAPEKSDTPVFRMYNPYAGEHHYTMDASEKDSMIAASWVDEGIGWYSDDAQTVPLYREYNPNEPANNHNYTTSKEEHDNLVSLGWTDEGYAWYGV